MSGRKFDPNAPRTREILAAAWTVALRLNQFGFDEIAAETGASIPLATKVVKHWVTLGRARLVVAARTGAGNRNLYEAIPEDDLAIPAVGDAYDQMWTVMRRFRAFSPTDLVAHCAVAIDIKVATGYCRTLLAGGYLRVTQKAKPPHKQATYQLTKQTGPRAPRTRNILCLIDANTGSTLPLLGGAS
jgi:hypothetical protein